MRLKNLCHEFVVLIIIEDKLLQVNRIVASGMQSSVLGPLLQSFRNVIARNRNIIMVVGENTFNFLRRIHDTDE